MRRGARPDPAAAQHLIAGVENRRLPWRDTIFGRVEDQPVALNVLAGHHLFHQPVGAMVEADVARARVPFSEAGRAVLNDPRAHGLRRREAFLFAN